MRNFIIVTASVAAADIAWELAGTFWGFTAIALLAAMSAVTAGRASAKSYQTQTRVGALVSQVGSLNQGVFSNVGGATVRLSSSFSQTLDCDALANFSSTINTSFLSGLSHQTDTTDFPSAPSTYSSTWGTAMVSACNALRATVGATSLIS